MPLLLSGPCLMGHATRLQRDAAPLLCYSPPWHLSRLSRHDVYLMVKIRLSSECLCKGTINIDWEFQRAWPLHGGPSVWAFHQRTAGAVVGSAPSWCPSCATQPFRCLQGHLCCCPCMSPASQPCCRAEEPGSAAVLGASLGILGQLQHGFAPCRFCACTCPAETGTAACPSD